MRVIPINTFQHRITFKNNQNDYSSYRLPVRDTFTPSFSGKNIIIPIKTQRDLKLRAMKVGRPCLYCNCPLTFDDSTYQNWKKSQLFSQPISVILKTLKPYKESLHETEKAIFSFLEFVSNTSPKVKLDEAIKFLAVEANKQLLKAQMPIFEELKLCSKELPVEYQYKLFELIQKSKFRMLKKPYLEEFSGKEFHYKLKNLAKTLPNENLADKICKYAELLTIPSLRMEGQAEEKVIKKVLNTISPQKNQKKESLKNPKYTNHRLKCIIIHTIKAEIKNLKRTDLMTLCNNAEKQLQGLPIVGKFSNKTFLYDLNELLEGYDDKQIRGKLFEIANKLPTSKDNIYAFITKHDEASSEKIAYDMLIPSIVTLEHMQPTFHNGANSIHNWATACKRCNNTRGDKDMEILYRQYNTKNAQKYWNSMIDDANKGFFDFEDMVGMLKIFKRQSKIKIDSRNLKYTPRK